MFIRKAFWLISFAQALSTLNAGFWDKGSSDATSDASESQPGGKVEYGVDMVRREYIVCVW